MYSNRKMFYASLSEQKFIVELAYDYLELSYDKQVWQMTDWIELARIWVELNPDKCSIFISVLSVTDLFEEDRYQFCDLQKRARDWLEYNYIPLSEDIVEEPIFNEDF